MDSYAQTRAQREAAIAAGAAPEQVAGLGTAHGFTMPLSGTPSASVMRAVNACPTRFIPSMVILPGILFDAALLTDGVAGLIKFFIIFLPSA